MHRCVTSLVAAATLVLAGTAAAQLARHFPQKALRGEITFGNPPEITLNGQASRLAPGSRIRDENNMMVVSGAIAGQKFTVNYTLDMLGQPQDVWILRRDEIANRPWPRTVEESQTWTFDAAAQTWSKP